MANPARITTALAAIGAVALCVLGFTSALEGAGPFKNLHAVKLGLVVGVLPAYFGVLWMAAWSTYRVRRLAQSSWRFTAFTAIALAAATGTMLAPLIPSASLAAVCLNQVLCPEVATPVLWAYLKLVTSLPAMPLFVGLAVVFAAAIAPNRSSAENEA